jgi:hypothetical protein
MKLKKSFVILDLKKSNEPRFELIKDLKKANKRRDSGNDYSNGFR